MGFFTIGKSDRSDRNKMQFLPPAYVVRQEGNVLTRVCPSICLSTGGYPYPIMLCNITQNSMGQTPGGVSCQVQPGEVPCQVQAGGTLLGGYPARGYPAGGDPARGAYPGWGVTLPVGVPCQGVPCWGVPCGGYPVKGVTQVGCPPGRVPPPGQVRTGGVSR